MKKNTPEHDHLHKHGFPNKKWKKEEDKTSNFERTFYRTLIILVIVALVIAVGYKLYTFLPDDIKLVIEDSAAQAWTLKFLSVFLVGFGAQMVDGILGMAYGVTCNSFLLYLQIPPAHATASVHVAKLFSSGVSGFSHLKFGNVNKKLVRSLVIPGALGALLGAGLISWLGKDALSKTITPYVTLAVSLYLVFISYLIFKKARGMNEKKKKTTNIGPIAFTGGFTDAIGGGGWGPVVTSNLIAKGRSPKYTIGSVNLAEFFIALTGVSVFTVMLKLENFLEIAGLILGGVLAAPFAAMLTGKVKAKPLMIFVSILIFLVCAVNITKVLSKIL